MSDRTSNERGHELFPASIPANEGGQDPGGDRAGELTALIRFRNTDRTNEPLGEFVDLSVTTAGFQDVGGIARSGDESGTVSAQRLANVLLQRFDRRELERLLSFVVDLHTALAR